MWHKKFPSISLINLSHRVDRLEKSTQIFHDFNIPFNRVEAIENKQAPCIGLVHTMQGIMRQALADGHENTLIFEDDIMPLVTKEVFTETMEALVNEMPDNFDQLFLGCNPAGGFTSYHSPHLLNLRFGYNTHAVIYSRKFMEKLVSAEINEPIDNFINRRFAGTSVVLATCPILFTQEPGHSDIGGNFVDWSDFIEKRFEEQLKLIK